MSAAVPLPEPPRTLDAFAVVALIAATAQALHVAVSGTTWVGVSAMGAVLGAATAYGVRRIRGERRWSAWAVTGAGILGWALAGSVLVLLPVALGLVLLRLDHGPRAAGAGVVAAVAGGLALLGPVHGRSPATIATEAVGLALILCAAVWVAGVFADSYRAQHAAEVASSERDRILSELEQTHAALAASIETQKELMLAQERARAAGELHDGLGHRLTAIRLSLDFVDQMWDEDPEVARGEVLTAREAASAALQEMRIWVRALNPSPAAALGDTAAFESIADAFRGTGMAVDVRTEGLGTPLGLELSLFARRFVQEGITNAVRHGSATQVAITISRDHDALRLRLRDNGVGTADGSATETATDVVEGFGLGSLRRRATSLGGTFDAGPTPSGFELTATVVTPQQDRAALS